MNSLLFCEFCVSAVSSCPIYPNMLNLQATDPNLEISFNIACQQGTSQPWGADICLLNSLYWTLRLELDSPTKAMSALTTSGGEVTHENSIKKREIEKNQIFWECTNIHQLNLLFWKLRCWLNTWPVAWPLSVSLSNSPILGRQHGSMLTRTKLLLSSSICWLL